MASAIIGGLVAGGRPGASILVIEPFEEQRERLRAAHGVRVTGAADAALAAAALVVWAVKPQSFREAVAPCASHVGRALQLSVMAGIRSDAIAAATGSERVVRAMPNTPALIGRGLAGLYARDAVSADDRASAEQVLSSTGALMWFDREEGLDAVTALSASGPAYVFYFLEAMTAAARDMGIDEDRGRQLAIATFAGATELARRSGEPLRVLRERVTSKGGTTHAALASMEADGVQAAFIRALKAAQQRAREMGDEFGKG